MKHFCREMGWTYLEYRQQPAKVVLRWMAYDALEARVANEQAER